MTAKDKGEPSRTGTATVRIYTENKNDEEPRFSQQVGIVSVMNCSLVLCCCSGVHS